MATNVKLGAKTILSLFTPLNNNEIWRATVPFIQAMAYLLPVKFLIESSNLFTNSPDDEIQPVSRHSVTYLSSFPEIFGTDNGIKICLLNLKSCY